jgi:large subunit ribosomal protein L10
MPKTEKIEKVAELKRRIEGSQALFLADFRGLTVADVSDLRRSLRESGTRVTVVKNTLMKLAAGQTDAADLERMLEGPTAVAFVDGDPITAAKGLVDAIRRFRTLALKGGYMEGRVLSAEEAQSLSTIEPREVLLAKLAGMAKAEMARALYMFQAHQSRFLALLDAYREKLPGQEPAAAETAPEPEAPEAAQEAPAAEPEATDAEPEPTEASAEAEQQPGETAPEGTPDSSEGAEPAPEEQEEQPGQEPPAPEETGSTNGSSGEDEEGKE